MSYHDSLVIAIVAVTPMIIVLFCLIGLAVHDYRKAKRYGGSFWG